MDGNRDEQDENTDGHNDWEEEDAAGDDPGFEAKDDAAETDIASSFDDDGDNHNPDNDLEPDAPVRAVSASSCHRRGDRDQRGASLVIQHADTGLSRLDTLFAPLMSVSPSANTTITGFFSRVAVLNVQGNALRDLSPLVLLAPSLRMLNAGENELASLPPRSFWTQFTHLELCFLSRNMLGPWTDGDEDADWLDALTGATELRWLTLAGNPAMTRPRARTAVVNKLRHLCALDDLVVADFERVQFARSTERYPVGDDDAARRLSLEVPRVFGGDNQALRFVDTARREVIHRHAHNSACVAIQRVLRGFVSRNYRRRHGRMCGLWTMRELVTRVQAAARGFLLRHRLQCQFEALVMEQGQQELLDLDPSQSLHVPLSARRGLQRLRALVQRWRRHLRDKKRAMAVTKIRVWCRMVRQRHRRRAEQLVRERQELIIYYDDDGHGDNEEHVVALASWAARRDPFLMGLPALEREQFLRARCSVPSGVRVLRSSVVPAQISSVLEAIGARSISHSERDSGTALVRVFPSDAPRETQVLVTQKRLLQSDLALVRSTLETVEQPTAAAGSFSVSRGLAVHLKQVEREIETRLVVCSKKVLAACINAQAWKQRAMARRPSLVKRLTKLRPRGFSLSRWERRKISDMCRPGVSRQDTDRKTTKYRTLQAFIPWSVDMYLLVLAGLTNQPTYRWWRYRSGLRRRLAFLRACVLVGASVNSHTLFMEARVFHVLRDRSRWDKIRAALFSRWPEQALPCRVNSEGAAVIAVNSQSLLKLRSASQEGVSLAQALTSRAYGATNTAASNGLKAQAAALAAQRCSSVLPAWLPGVPEHEEATMSSRTGEDATPSLLSEGVEAEPTLLERELMLHGGGRGREGSVADVFAQTNPFRCMVTGHQVAEAATQLMALARELHSQQMPSSRGGSPSRRQSAALLLVLETTSLVRLQFESVDEARRRALLLLAKTFDPVTNTFAQLHSLEALVGAALRHHQWALSQLPNADKALSTLDSAQHWLNTRFPSPWWTAVERRLSKMGMSASVIAELSTFSSPSPPVTRPVTDRRTVSATSPTEASIAACYRDSHGRRVAFKAPAAVDVTPTQSDGPMRVIVTVASMDAQTTAGVAPIRLPRPPSSTLSAPPVDDSAPSSTGSNRHQLLANRLGQSKAYESIAELRREQHEQRMYQVRDLREERERAMEALIVDRRMQQRESAAEVAGVKLDIDVKLVKLRYERELDRLSARESMEQDKLETKRSKLTHEFERQFAAQSGALMRRAARDAMARSKQTQHEQQKQRAKEVRERDAEELDRRRDAKSWWFVNNQRARRELGAQKQVEAVEVANDERVRLAKARQKIREDKEIKGLLRIM